jgi:hypothetical protein
VDPDGEGNTLIENVEVYEGIVSVGVTDEEGITVIVSRTEGEEVKLASDELNAEVDSVRLK